MADLRELQQQPAADRRRARPRPHRRRRAGRRPVTKGYGTEAAAFTRQYCLEHNVLIGVGGNFGNVLRVQPPLVISDEQLDAVFATITGALEAYAGRA